jgi:UDP-glucose 4-epimerase
MSKILVTGGAGYIGSHVNKALAAKGYDTLVLDNLVYGHREFVKWGEFVLADLSDRSSLELVFQKNNIQAVMHFAAFAYVGESVEDPRKYYRNNVSNTINLLDTVLDHKVKAFIFSSSCATYGIPQHVPIAENHPQNPMNPYGQSKFMIEKILADYDDAYGLPYVSLRYFNAAGADPDCEIGEWHDPETHLVPILLDAAIGRRQCIEIYGTDYPTKDGTCIRDYIHVLDLAQAHILALEYLLSGGRSDVFNLGNGNGFSVREVMSCAREVTKTSIAEKESPRRAGDPPVLVGSAEKAGMELGWKPRFNDLNSIIDTAWRWHRKLDRLL